MKRDKRVTWHRTDAFARDIKGKRVAIVGGTADTYAKRITPLLLTPDIEGTFGPMACVARPR
jgi:hypothetical protein